MVYEQANHSRKDSYLQKGAHWTWNFLNEPPHDKTNKLHMCPANTQISLGIRPVWSESSLSAWRKIWSLATHWVHSKDSDQTGRMPRLIWVFACYTIILSCCGSNKYLKPGPEAKWIESQVCNLISIPDWQVGASAKQSHVTSWRLVMK